MLKKDYKDILDPITDQVIEHFMLNESKHCEGLRCNSRDITKVVTHSVSSVLGDTNPDGASHAVAALSRAYKAVLYEQTQGERIMPENPYKDIKVGMTKAND
tara:strand:- start:2525 stop:2830 length:306 start_codon:yes stop_codon:yes gene_type:complete